MRQLQNLFGVLLLLVTGLTLCGCGNGDNALEEIINGGGGSSSSDPSGVSYVAYTASGTTATPTTKTLADGEYIVVNDELAELTGEKPYVVNSDVTIDHDVTISADAELIICDGKTLTINGTLKDASTTYSLSLYGQTNETGTLKVDCTDPEKARTIMLKELNISGINLIATTANNFAIDLGRDFNIYHGSLDAKNTSTTGSYCVSARDFYIYDGCTINATGREKAIEAATSINIYGGTITATAGYASGGIGGYAIVIPGSGGTLNISGGTLTANGGNAQTGSNNIGGHGIIVGSITIDGGTINAYGGNGDGSKAGGYGIQGTIIMNGGNVNATGGNGGNTGNGSYGIFSTSTEQAVDYKGGKLIAFGGTHGSGGGSNGKGMTYDADNGCNSYIKNSTTAAMYYDWNDGTSGWSKIDTPIAIGVKAANASFGIRLPSEL